ncbi:SHOCT domain-containing protein [Ornithinimicrobium sp. Y1694]|uniref:SHOCT domain-containing protein n=1 Tax=Ornithinimicrobium sp. Y1694 TaxID=3418590 RepID=UPI003CF9893F
MASDEPILDPTLSNSRVAAGLGAAQRHLRDGERVVGLHGVSRFRRSVAFLVLTDQRVFTLGLEHEAYPVVDDLDHFAIERLEVEREGVLRFGDVRAYPSSGPDVMLGSLNVGLRSQGLTAFDEALRAVRKIRESAPLTPIDLPAPPLPLQGGVPSRTFSEGTVPSDSVPSDSVPSDSVPSDSVPPRATPSNDARGDQVLVDQLTELARLHQAGLLTDEEFAAAKARVLG